MTKDNKPGDDSAAQEPSAEVAEGAPLGNPADTQQKASTGDAGDQNADDRTADAESSDDADQRWRADADPSLTQSGTVQDSSELDASDGNEDAANVEEAQELVADEVTEPEPVAKPKGRGLAAFALLLALIGVGGVGYLYYLLVYTNPLGVLKTEKDALASQYTALEQKLASDLAAVEQSNAQALQSAAANQEERLASNEKAVVKSLQEAINTAPPSEKEWKLAEAQYMLRIANHRVLMEQDSEGALRLLQASDQILQELDDFAFHQVRARLADEIVSLKQVRRDDLQGIYLQLEAIKSQIESLPYLTPEYLQQSEVTETDESVWQTLYNEFTKFVRVRTLAGEESIKPLLAPEEERYVELNLRLAVEQAQLAALRRHQGVFDHSLQSIVNWLTDYMDADDSKVRGLLEQTQALQSVELERPLPDVSGSLNELRDALRSDS